MSEVEMKILEPWTEKTWARNVHIDSILIRLRSLIEFLCATSTRFDTDVIARHYAPDFKLPEDECTWLTDRKRAIDTSLAHLTIVPMPKLISEVEFPYTEIYQRVMNGLKLFFDHNPPNVLQQTWDAFARAYELSKAIP
jgi:hypothetical protein